PDIAGPRTSVLSRAPAAAKTQPEHFDPFLDLAIKESKTARKAPPTYESVMTRLAEHKAAKSQTAVALKPSAPSPIRQPPPRRAPSTTSTVSSRSTQRDREMSPVAWQPLLPKTKAATPLPAPQPVKAASPLLARQSVKAATPLPAPQPAKAATPLPAPKPVMPIMPPPAPQTMKYIERWSGKITEQPLPSLKGGRTYKAPGFWERHKPDNQRLPGKSCLKSGSQLTEATKSVRWKKNPTGCFVIVARWINPEDCHENFETTRGKLRRFNNARHVMGNQDGTATHEDCGCTMNVLQLTPEKHLPFYADTILADCRQLNLKAASSARMCSTFDGTGITN
ncbi:hypothetical protein MMC27_006899, partial [Xylographa pallens]|nr:hypothetical protein [Xylographa pallens]